MPELSEDRQAHLGMIQTVIARMAGESARTKQFALVALGALASTAEATGSWALACVAGVLSLVFWMLDAQYLAQERWFRGLYDKVRGETGPTDFAMRPDADIRSRNTVMTTMKGWSVAPLYVLLLVISLLIALSVGVSNDTPETEIPKDGASRAETRAGVRAA